MKYREDLYCSTGSFFLFILQQFDKIGRSANRDRRLFKMLCVPGNNTIDAGSFCTGNHNGILVIVIFYTKCVLTIFSQCIDDPKQGQNTGNNFPDLAVGISFAFELFS